MISSTGSDFVEQLRASCRYAESKTRETGCFIDIRMEVIGLRVEGWKSLRGHRYNVARLVAWEELKSVYVPSNLINSQIDAAIAMMQEQVPEAVQQRS